MKSTGYMERPSDCGDSDDIGSSESMADSRPKLRGVTLGERVKEAIDLSGMTKAEIARRVGISFQGLSGWAKGTQPQLHHFQKFANVTGVTLEELMGAAEGQEPRGAGWTAFRGTAEFRSASPEELKAVRAVLWPEGMEPSATSYLLVLQAVRAAVPKKR
jgi:transcriptional regulator with XRE-family HTH domain